MIGFVFLFCLLFRWGLGDAWSCIQVISFVWVLTIWYSLGLEEEQAGIKIARRNINNLRYADDTTLMAENEEELNSFFMKVTEKSEKVA